MTIYYDLEVTLRGLRRPPKRRFFIHERATFLDLHEAIKAAFGAKATPIHGEHLWSFAPGPDGYMSVATNDPDQGPRADLVLLPEYFGYSGALYGEAHYFCYGEHSWWDYTVKLKRVLELKGAATHWRKLYSGLHGDPPPGCAGAQAYKRLRAILEDGEDPWGELEGEDAAALLEVFGMSDASLTFRPEAQCARFDLALDPKQQRRLHETSAPPVVEQRVSIAAQAGAKPKTPDAALLQAHITRYLSCEPCASWMLVFELIESFLRIHRRELGSNVILALCAWLFVLVTDEQEGGVLKARKPKIYAAALIYWLDSLFGGQPHYSQLSAQWSVSAPSIKAAAQALEALVGDARSPQTLEALMRFANGVRLDMHHLITGEPAPAPPSAEVEAMLAPLLSAFEGLQRVDDVEAFHQLMQRIAQTDNTAELAQHARAIQALIERAQATARPTSQAKASKPKRRKRRR